MTERFLTLGRGKSDHQLEPLDEHLSNSQSSPSLYSPSNSTSFWDTSASSIGDYQHRVKSAASGIVNRFLYGKWRRKTDENFADSPTSEGAGNSIIWLLGRPYVLEENDKSAYDEFLIDFRSRIWLSYRENFPPLLDSSKVSDCGWGCMLRCAQMMVAQAVLLQKLGRDWRLEKRWKCAELEAIIRLFEDCESAPLGIHRILKAAQNAQNLHAEKRRNKSSSNAESAKLNGQKKCESGDASDSPKTSSLVGRWFAASEAISHLRDIIDSNASNSPLIARLRVYLSVDMNVIVDEVVELSENWQCSVLLVVSVRLGTKHINTIYYNQLKSLFSVEQFCGAIGGRPKRAFYFVGCIGDRLYYLDPHTVQKYEPLGSEGGNAKSSSEEISSVNSGKKKKNSIISLRSSLKSRLTRNSHQSSDSADSSAEDERAETHVNKTRQEFERVSGENTEANEKEEDKELENEERKWMSFHSVKTPSVPLAEVDPSCAIGFLLSSRRELDACIEDLVLANVIEFKSRTKGDSPTKMSSKTPLFTVFENREQLCNGNHRGTRKVGSEFENCTSSSSPSPVMNDDGFEVL